MIVDAKTELRTPQDNRDVADDNSFPFDELNNPGHWSSFTYCPFFEPKGGYMFHTMPAGATAVPVDKVTGKR
jgi:hypothetical protein